MVLNRTVVDTDYIHSDDHAQPAYKIPFVVYCFLTKLHEHHDKSNSFQYKDDWVLHPGGGGRAYNWVNVLLSGKWAYNWGVVGGGGVILLYMVIYGLVYGGKCL